MVSDTKALYNVLIKEQQTFEVTEWFLECVRLNSTLPGRLSPFH